MIELSIATKIINMVPLGILAYGRMNDHNQIYTSLLSILVSVIAFSLAYKHIDWGASNILISGWWEVVTNLMIIFLVTSSYDLLSDYSLSYCGAFIILVISNSIVSLYLPYER